MRKATFRLLLLLFCFTTVGCQNNATTVEFGTTAQTTVQPSQFPSESPFASQNYTASSEISKRPLKAYDIECGKGVMVTVTEEQWNDSFWSASLLQSQSEESIRVELYQDDGTNPRFGIGTTLAVSQEDGETAKQIIAHFVDPIAYRKPFFEDVNQDGYADLVLTDTGTMNTFHNFYIWDSQTKNFVFVSVADDNGNRDGGIGYYEVHDGYIAEWQKNSGSNVYYAEYVWEDACTLRLSNEEHIDLSVTIEEAED